MRRFSNFLNVFYQLNIEEIIYIHIIYLFVRKIIKKTIIFSTCFEFIFKTSFIYIIFLTKNNTNKNSKLIFKV